MIAIGCSKECATHIKILIREVQKEHLLRIVSYYLIGQLTMPTMKFYLKRNSLLSNFWGDRLWQKGLTVAGTTLLMMATATAAEAATFTVNFSGFVDALTAVSGGSPGNPPTPTEPDALTLFNTGTPVTTQDAIVGSYVFEDTTNELLGARFRFVSPDSGESLDPSEAAASDIVFESLPDLDADFLNNTGTQRRTTSSANDSSATYQRNVSVIQEVGGRFSSLSVDAQSFEYREGGSFLGGPNGFDGIVGTINLFERVDSDEPDPSDPDVASVPEPTAILGLLAIAGMGVSLTRRDRSAFR